MYVSMASAEATLDAGAAATMISGYRANNGLGGVSVDPELMQLAQTQARLRMTREDSESANEELRAANEELQSINEEYRSTSEELETSKEELQSINEELQTVNSELKLKLEAVSRAHSDLRPISVPCFSTQACGSSVSRDR